MEATLYPQNKKEIPWRMVMRVAMAVIAVGIIVGAAFLVARSSRRARAFETMANIFTIRTGLEQYYLSHARYPKNSMVSIPLGAGEAMCLDNSVQGFQFLCSGEIFIAALPRARDGGFYLYTPTEDGYRLDFAMSARVGSLRDTNRDGKIICAATPSAIDCK